MLGLQGQVGNAAVARALARQPADVKPKPSEPPITTTGPRGAQDWYDRADAHYRAGRYAEALKAFEEAYRLHPSAGLLYNQAACLEQLGRKSEAADMYERYLDEQDKDVYDTKTPQIRERIKTLRGQSTAPETKGKGGAQAASDRAWAHWQAGRYDDALKEFQEAHRLDPLPRYLYNQASVLVALKRDTEAADLFERYLNALPKGSPDPEETKIRDRITRLRSKTQSGGQTGAGQTTPAPKQQAPLPPITAKGKDGARQWFDRGQDAFAAGDFSTALEAFKKAHSLFPMPEFVFNQASALEKLGRTAAAAKAFEHYLVLNPNAKDAKETVEKIKMLREQAAKEKIIDPWEDESAAPAVTETGLKGAQQWFDRGQVAYKLGDFKRSYECFVRAYDLKPFPQFVYNQGAVLYQLGNYEGAIQAYERYLLLDPKASDAEAVRKHIARLKEKLWGK